MTTAFSLKKTWSVLPIHSIKYYRFYLSKLEKQPSSLLYINEAAHFLLIAY